VRRLAFLLLFLLFASTATAATIRGTKTANLIIGTPTPDRIVAGAGNDLVQASFGGTDSVNCGVGLDIVSADAVDKVASSCEVVSRRLSVDPYKNSDSQHETAVEPDSASWGDTVVAVFQVGRRLGGAASNIGTAVSHDDGRTWARALLPGMTTNASPPGPETAASDPSIAYDAVHGMWLASTLTLEGGNSPHIWISRSTDGLHWSAPIDAADGEILDKEWIACDNGDDQSVPWPVLSRVHGRLEEHHHEPVLDRRGADVVTRGAGGCGSRRHSAGRAAGWNARRRCGRLRRRAGCQRGR